MTFNHETAYSKKAPLIRLRNFGTDYRDLWVRHHHIQHISNNSIWGGLRPLKLSNGHADIPSLVSERPVSNTYMAFDVGPFVAFTIAQDDLWVQHSGTKLGWREMVLALLRLPPLRTFTPNTRKTRLFSPSWSQASLFSIPCVQFNIIVCKRDNIPICLSNRACWECVCGDISS
jgi:hypothetical protein